MLFVSPSHFLLYKTRAPNPLAQAREMVNLTDLKYIINAFRFIKMIRGPLTALQLFKCPAFCISLSQTFC